MKKLREADCDWDNICEAYREVGRIEERLRLIREFPALDLKQKVIIRDGFKCALCYGENSLQVHHKTPKSIGGTNEMTNLITLCANCHVLAHKLKEWEEKTPPANPTTKTEEEAKQ